MQVSIANELHDLTVRDGSRLVYTLIDGQELLPPSAVAYEEFSVYQLVPLNLIES
jgi:hypothetical protein